MLRIVVDTNVVIRAIFHGDRHSQQVLKLVSGGRVAMVMTHQIQEEVLPGRRRPCLARGGGFRTGRRPLQKALRLTQKAHFIEAPPVFAACEDSSDNKFFDCAIAGRADYVVPLPRVYLNQDAPRLCRSARALERD